jgi:hypothetical protein
MNFKEFVAFQELDLIAEELERNPNLLDEEQIDEVLGSALKFAGGAIGNLATQTARGVGNLVTGAAQGAYGIAQTGTGALQFAGGGKEAGKQTLKRGASNLWRGGGKLLRGGAQTAAALTGVSPLLRGAQATGEKGITGVYAPAAADRTKTQDMLGLNSWKGKQQQQQPSEKPRYKIEGEKMKFLCPNGHVLSVPKSEHGRPTICPQCNNGSKFYAPTIGDAATRKKELQELGNRKFLAKQERQEKRNQRFKELVDAWKRTKDPRVQKEIATEFPKEYQAALMRAKSARQKTSTPIPATT